MRLWWSARGMRLPRATARHTALGQLFSNRSESAAMILILCILGLTISLMAYSRLELGIISERWKPQEVESLRAFIELPLLRFCVIALALGAMTITICAGQFKNVSWPILALVFPFILLRMATRLPPTTVHESISNHAAPIRSEHWGQSHP